MKKAEATKITKMLFDEQRLRVNKELPSVHDQNIAERALEKYRDDLLQAFDNVDLFLWEKTPAQSRPPHP